MCSHKNTWLSERRMFDGLQTFQNSRFLHFTFSFSSCYRDKLKHCSVSKKQNLIQKILCLPLISLSGRPAAVAYKWDLTQKNDLILDLWNKEAIFKLKG